MKLLLREAAGSMTQDDRFWAEQVVGSFNELAAGATASPSSPSWSPQLAQGRNLEILGRVSPGYAQPSLIALLVRIRALKLPRDQVVITHFGNGLPAIFWSLVFRKVLIIAQNAAANRGFEEHGPITICRGEVDNTRFMYNVVDRLTGPSLIVLDDDRYSRFISPYFLFRERLVKPGMCVFFDRAVGDTEESAVRKFFEDLRSGFLDGVLHDVRAIDPDHGESRVLVESLV